MLPSVQSKKKSSVPVISNVNMKRTLEDESSEAAGQKIAKPVEESVVENPQEGEQNK